MNAYELADKLQEIDAKLHLIDLFKSADMLRQQADRIAELEKELAFMEGEYPEPTIVEKMKEYEKQSEPVAWTWFSSVENKSPYTQMTGYTTECWSWNKPDESVKVDEGTLMPLYTTPQTKPLTEDEIINLWHKAQGVKHGN